MINNQRDFFQPGQITRLSHSGLRTKLFTSAMNDKVWFTQAWDFSAVRKEPSQTKEENLTQGEMSKN